MDLFVIMPLTIITKCSILDVATVLDPPLKIADLTVFLLFFIQNLLSRCGGIEENPGPK